MQLSFINKSQWSRIGKIILFTFLFLFCFSSFYVQSADALAQQRFQEWRLQFKSLTQLQQQQRLNELKHYALYSYALADYLTNPKNEISNQEIISFATQYPHHPNLLTVKQIYVTKLTQQQNWKAIQVLNYKDSIALTCQWMYADYQVQPELKKLQKVGEIWTQGADLSSSCDPLFKLWSATSYKTTSLILKRVDALLKNNKFKLAATIADQLPNSEKMLKTALVNVINQPKMLAKFVDSQSNKPAIKAIAFDLFARYSAQNMNGALNLMQTMQKKYKLTSTEMVQLSTKLAQTYFSVYATPQQIKWRQKQSATLKNSNLIEQEIRLALRQNDKKARDKWLKLLPPNAKQKEEWRYWTAISLMEKGKKTQARQILEKLAAERGFYGLVSAQTLNIPYQVNLNYEIVPQLPPVEAQKWIQKKYQSTAEVRRIKELKALNMQLEAKREWWFFVNRHDKAEQAELAKFAFDQNWEVESIQATIAGKHWDHWNERLPIVYRDMYTQALQDKAISLSYSLAIARQESALDPSVQSPVGARGLMQLMPATAKEVAKKTNQNDYTSSADLFKPEINIALGTSFLEMVYNQFDQNRILAAAAYNAGPNRVNQWLSQTNNQLDVMAFIESIPFTETRNYVKSVLTYDYYYQVRMNQKLKKILTEKEWLRRY